MKYKLYHLFWYTLILNIFKIHFSISKSDNENDIPKKYTIDFYDENNNFKNRVNVTYNHETNLFLEDDELTEYSSINWAVICNNEDIDKMDNEKETVILWNTSFPVDKFSGSLTYMNAFPLWAYEQRKKGKIFCLKIENVGWYRNVNDEICKDDKPCPDMIILGTTQLAYRYNNKETLNLEKYFRRYFKNNGKSIESLLNKYSFYDYHIDNNWLAVPIIVDFRSFKFNITTFDYCIKKGYDLHYPPPFSDFWGKNYDTWTWEVVFDYAKAIYNCTGKPGFNFFKNDSYEDAKFFIIVCQALGIPFVTEDIDLNLKKCGFRKKEYIKKLSILKELFENRYIENWLQEDSLRSWMNSSYPKSVDDFPKLRSLNSMKSKNLFAMSLNVLEAEANEEIKVSYVPGGTTFLGGSGIIITEGSKFPDELFEYIEILINEKYSFCSQLNSIVTPYSNMLGNRCIKNNYSKKELCNNYLETDGTIPYYYYYNKNMNIIYLTHKSMNSDRGIIVDTKNSLNSELVNSIFTNGEFKCDEEINYNKKTITIENEDRIIIPISENKSIILKQMDTINHHQTMDMVCSIYKDTLSIAKPYQFPYNTFSEINVFENNDPISILFAHLYYNFYNGNQTFEDIINECCDIIDYSFTPNCKNYSKIKIKVSDCEGKDNMRTIEYLNCKTNNDTDFYTKIKCDYISYTNF
ncbi:hypothetical protein BCR32DRAFT_245899, partial [Anaeromyces robustus]